MTPTSEQRIYEAIEAARKEQRECHEKTMAAINDVKTEQAETRAATKPCRDMCLAHNKAINGNGGEGLKARVTRLEAAKAEPRSTSKLATSGIAGGSSVFVMIIYWLIQKIGGQ
jgi:hypothetical protein